MATLPVLETPFAVAEPAMQTVSEAAVPSRSAVRIPELDGLRGVAILLVLLCHGLFEQQPKSKLLTGLLVVGRLTWSGVDLFFVLSGFLIGGILLDACRSPRYYQTFYARRVFRILPLYGLLLALFSIRFLTPNGSAGPLGAFSATVVPLLSYATFTQNIAMALAGTFGAGTMAATWSLAVEEQFYLTIPWAIRQMSRRKLMWCLLGVVIAAPVLRTALLVFYHHGGFAAYVLMPCRADALSLGVLSALLMRTPAAWTYLLARRSKLVQLTWLLASGLVVLTYRGESFSNSSVVVGYSWLGLFYTACLLLAVSTPSGWFRSALRSGILRVLGLYSYCVYLIHLPLMEASRRLLGLTFPYSSDAVQFLGGILGIACSLAIAALSWKCLERPLLRRGQAYTF